MVEIDILFGQEVKLPVKVSLSVYDLLQIALERSREKLEAHNLGDAKLLGMKEEYDFLYDVNHICSYKLVMEMCDDVSGELKINTDVAPE